MPWYIFSILDLFIKNKKINKTKHILYKSMQIYAKWEFKTLILNHSCISNNIFFDKLWTKNVKEIPNIGENNYIVDSPIPGVNATTCIKQVFKGMTTMGENYYCNRLSCHVCKISRFPVLVPITVFFNFTANQFLFRWKLKNIYDM